MPVQKRSYDRFEYILYDNKTNADIAEFRQEILRLEQTYDNQKDIIVDLSLCIKLISPEIGLLAKTAKISQKANRSLWLVCPCPAVDSALKHVGLSDRNNVVLYNSMRDLFVHLQKDQKAGASPSAINQSAETLALQGSLTGIKIKPIAEGVKSALKGNCNRIILDFSRVESIDTMFIGELITLDEIAKRLRKSIVLSHPSESVLSLMREASLDKSFEIIP